MKHKMTAATGDKKITHAKLCWNCGIDCNGDNNAIKILYKLDGIKKRAWICKAENCLLNFRKWSFHTKDCRCKHCSGHILGFGCISCGNRIKDNGKWIPDSFIDKKKQATMQLFCSDACMIKRTSIGLCVCGEFKCTVVCSGCNVIKYCTNECLEKDKIRHTPACDLISGKAKKT